MIRTMLGTACLSAVLPGVSLAASIPHGLHGKSIIVAWSESRLRTFEGANRPE
jgi:hypothetical protein